MLFCICELVPLALADCRQRNDVVQQRGRLVVQCDCYPRRSHSAIGVDIVLTLDVCMFVC